MTTLSELQGSQEFQDLSASDQQKVLESVAPAEEAQPVNSWGAVESSPEFTGLSFDDQNRVRSYYDVPEVEQPSRKAYEYVTDPLVAGAQGVIGLGGAAVGLVDLVTPGDLQGTLKDTFGYDPKESTDFLEGYLSESQKNVNRDITNAEGFGETLVEYIKNPSAIGQELMKSAPTMLAGGAVARALPAGVGLLTRAAVGEGVPAAGAAQAEFTERLGRETTLKEKAHAVATGMSTAAINRLGGTLAKKIGIADIDSYLAGQVGVVSKGKVLGRMAAGGVTEGVIEEMPQSSVEKVLENSALERPLFEGVPEAAATGLAIGGVMGAGVNVVADADAQTERVATEVENTRDENGFMSAANVVKANEIRDAGKDAVVPPTIEERALDAGKKYDALRPDVREGLTKPLPAEQAVLDEVETINNEIVEKDIQDRVAGAGEIRGADWSPEKPLEQIVEPVRAETIEDVRHLAAIKREGRLATEQMGMERVAPPEVQAPTVSKAAPIEAPHVDAMTSAISQGGIDIASAKQMFSPETISALNRKRPGLFRVEGGQQVDELAGELGYDSADNMVERWSAVGTKKASQEVAQAEEQAQFDIAEDAANVEKAETVKLYGQFRSEILKEPAAVSVEEINYSPFTDSQKADLIKLRGTPKVKRFDDKQLGVTVPFDEPPLTEKRAGVKERSFQRKLNQVLKGDTGQTGAIMSVLGARAGSLNMSTGEYLNQRGMDIVPDSQAFDKGIRQANKGAVVINEHEAVIHAFSQADGTTALHEMSHIFRRDLGRDDTNIVEKWAGVKDGKWATSSEEKFSRGFERYVTEGVSPTKALEKVFKKLKDIMLSVYGSLSHPDIDIDISPEIRAVFDRMLGGDQTLLQGKQVGVAGPLMQQSTTKKLEDIYSGEKKYAVKEDDTYDVLKHEMAINLEKLGFKDSEQFKQVLSMVQRKANEDNVEGKAIREAQARVPKETRPELQGEATLAYLTANHPEISVVKQLIAQVKKFLVENVGVSSEVLKTIDLQALAVSVLQKESKTYGKKQRPGVHFKHGKEERKTAAKEYALDNGTTERLFQTAKRKPAVDTGIPERGLTGKTLTGEAKSAKEKELKAADFHSRYSENVKNSERGQKSLPPLAVPDRGVAVPSDVAGENFDRWFGESLAVDKKGKPMVWFHGSPTFGKAEDPESWSFDPARRGENVGHTFTGFGTTFTSNFSEADFSARGEAAPLAFHLRMENPYILTDADIAKLSRYSKDDKHTAKAEAFTKRKMDLGDYDSIYNPKTGFIYLANSAQSKSLANTGLYGEVGDILMQGKQKPVDTESPEFKKWFGDSKVVNENGEPLVVYHGTSAEFREFDKERIGETYGVDDVGFFFSSDRDEAQYSADESAYKREDDDAEGLIVNAYLSIGNPLIVTSGSEYIAEFGKGNAVNTFDQNKQLILEDVEDGEHDGLIVRGTDGEGDLYMTFNPTQIKSATSNVGAFDLYDPDIFMQSAPVTAEDYATNRATKGSTRSAVGRNVRATVKEISKGFDKFLGSISTRLGDINPKLKAKVKALDFKIGTKQHKDMSSVVGMLESAKKRMSREDFQDWDYARKNSDTGMINDLVEKYGFREEYTAYRDTLDRLHSEAEDVGLDVGYIEEYAPRLLKDATGFLNHIGKGDDWPVISRKLMERADEMSITIEDMTDEMKADLVSNMMFGGMYGMGGPAGTKARAVKTIDPELNQYYMDSDSALVNYIHSMRKTIEQRKFFGKVPKKISDAKSNMHRAMSQIRKEEAKDTPSERRLKTLRDNVVMYRDLINKFKYNNSDYTESISQFVTDLALSGEINPDQQKTIVDIMTARFNERGARGLVQAYKNFSYMDTMGSPISALTQIGDQAFAAYEGGWINALKNSAKAFRGKSRITKEDVGIDRMAQEFADESTLAKAVNTVFKYVGLEKIDSIGKESLLNTSLEKYENRAKKEPGKLAKEIEYIFGEETQDVITDLQEKQITDNVKLLVYSRLLDFQPAALSEMPEQYLKAGNGRIFYMLKTYTLKQFDVFRREAYKDIRHGSREEKIAAVKRMMRLSMFLVMANAGADELKDLALNRKTDLSDRVVDNVLRLFGVSKYIGWQARQEGVGTAMAKQILPPYKFINAVSKDIVSAGDEKGLFTTGSIPFVGKLAHWHMGRGTRRREDLYDKRIRDKKRELNKIKERVERNPDEAGKYRKELRKLSKMNRFQIRLNKNRRSMNELQAKGANRRVKRLQKQRVSMIKDFLASL